ncbi:MAG: SIS domain-containing protein [Phycisphaerales bacterium]|nr:SIS domain-containing protein [Phycisphaerales bacterium]
MPSFARTAQESFRFRLQQAERALAALAGFQGGIETIIQSTRDTLANGKMVLTCGNGGSAAEALHLSEELIGRYRSNRPPFKSICLTADPTALTCIANDFGFERVFARQLEGLASRGDQLIVFSTSGASANILRALESARALGVRTVGLLGGDGGDALSLCDHAIVISGVDGAAVQEIHQMIVHILCESLEPATAHT